MASITQIKAHDSLRQHIINNIIDVDKLRVVLIDTTKTSVTSRDYILDDGENLIKELELGESKETKKLINRSTSVNIGQDLEKQMYNSIEYSIEGETPNINNLVNALYIDPNLIIATEDEDATYNKILLIQNLENRTLNDTTTLNYNNVLVLSQVLLPVHYALTEKDLGKIKFILQF